MLDSNRIIYPLLAKVGHKLEGDEESQAKELWKHYHDEEIETYEMKRLSTFQDLLDSNSPFDDIVMVTEIRKYSLDYDYCPRRTIRSLPPVNIRSAVKVTDTLNTL